MQGLHVEIVRAWPGRGGGEGGAAHVEVDRLPLHYSHQVLINNSALCLGRVVGRLLQLQPRLPDYVLQGLAGPGLGSGVTTQIRPQPLQHNTEQSQLQVRD